MTDVHGSLELFGRDFAAMTLREFSQREGIFQITGESGIGKSAMLRALGGEFDDVDVIDARGRSTDSVIDAIDPASLLVLVDHVDRSHDPLKLLGRLAASTRTAIIASRRTYPTVDGTLRLGPLKNRDAVTMVEVLMPGLLASTHLIRLVDLLDRVPRALEAAADRLRDVAPIQLIDEIESGAFGDSLDELAWSIVPDGIAESTLAALAACARLADDFDAAAFEAVSGLESSVLDELFDESLLSRSGTSFRMLWPVRERFRARTQ